MSDTTSNTVTAQLVGMDYFTVTQHLRRLTKLQSTADRRALLERIQANDGSRIRGLVEDAFREEWDRRIKEAAQ